MAPYLIVGMNEWMLTFLLNVNRDEMGQINHELTIILSGWLDVYIVYKNVLLWMVNEKKRLESEYLKMVSLSGTIDNDLLLNLRLVSNGQRNFVHRSTIICQEKIRHCQWTMDI